jgi:signal transduction histidine kinase
MRCVKRNIRAVLFQLLFVFTAWTALAQNSQVDSVNTAMRNAKNDTTIARGYMTLAGLLYASDPDTVIPLSNKALELVDRKLPGANEKEKHSYLLTKAAAFSNIGYAHFQHGETEKAMEYFNKGLKIQEEINDPQEIANSLNNIAAIYWKLGENEKALDHFKRALEMQKKLPLSAAMATTINNIGGIYDNQGQVKLALDYYYEGLKLQEQLDNKIGIGTSFNNIAAILMKQGETDKAFEYYNRSLKARQEADDKRGIAQCLNNIAHIYMKKGEYEKALENYEKSYTIYSEIKHNPGIAYSYNNIAAVYQKQHLNDKALDYFNKSLATYEAVDDKKGIANTSNNIGQLLLEQGKAAQALPYSKRALDVAQAGGFAEVTRDVLSVLSKIETALGKNADALEHYKKYVVFRDSLNNEETKKAGIRKQIQYEYDKKEEQAKLEDERKELIRLEAAKRQEIINWSLIVGCVLVLATAFLLFNRYRLKQKNKYQQELSLKQKEQAVAVMETQEQERKRIAEDLHDSLGHLLSTAKLNLQTVPDVHKQYVENSLQLLNQASEEIHNITFNLMPRTLEEGGLVAALNELAAKVTNSGKVKILLHVHDIDRFVLEKQSQFNIYRIIQEAVNNILKHAEASEINIQLIGQNNHMTIMIEDDGKGFDTGTKKSGRGLKNIVTRSLWLNGHINIDSTPGRGTTITTEIPT